MREGSEVGMTREEFMKHAEEEIDQAFRGQRNRMMNLVEQAWAEGKRNAELNGVIDVVREAFDKMVSADVERAEKCTLVGADGGINGLHRLIPAQVQGVRKEV